MIAIVQCALCIFTISAHAGLMDNDAERYCTKNVPIKLHYNKKILEGGGDKTLPLEHAPKILKYRRAAISLFF